MQNWSKNNEDLPFSIPVNQTRSSPPNVCARAYKKEKDKKKRLKVEQGRLQAYKSAIEYVKKDWANTP